MYLPTKEKLFTIFFSFFFRRLGDEMRSMSLEKTRQREVELAQEIDRLQMEIKTLQKNSEEAANVNQQLSKEVKYILYSLYFSDILQWVVFLDQKYVKYF